jgi:hypothetical protein
VSHLIDHLDKFDPQTLNSIVNLAISTTKILELSCQSCPLSFDQLTRLFAAFISNCLVISDDEIKEVSLSLFVVSLRSSLSLGRFGIVSSHLFAQSLLYSKCGCSLSRKKGFSSVLERVKARWVGECFSY